MILNLLPENFSFQRAIDIVGKVHYALMEMEKKGYIVESEEELDQAGRNK